MSLKPKGFNMTFPWRRALKGPDSVMGTSTPRLRRARTKQTSLNSPESPPAAPNKSINGSSGQMFLLATRIRRLYRLALDPVTRAGSRLRTRFRTASEFCEGPAAVWRRYITLAAFCFWIPGWPPSSRVPSSCPFWLPIWLPVWMPVWILFWFPFWTSCLDSRLNSCLASLLVFGFLAQIISFAYGIYAPACFNWRSQVPVAVCDCNRSSLLSSQQRHRLDIAEAADCSGKPLVSQTSECRHHGFVADTSHGKRQADRRLGDHGLLLNWLTSARMSPANANSPTEVRSLSELVSIAGSIVLLRSE